MGVRLTAAAAAPLALARLGQPGARHDSSEESQEKIRKKVYSN